VAAGKAAAEMIDKYLKGLPVQREYRLTRPTTYLAPVVLTEAESEAAKRPQSPRLDPAARKAGFREVEGALAETAAVLEARRCLRCDLETEDGKAALAAASGASGACRAPAAPPKSLGR